MHFLCSMWSHRPYRTINVKCFDMCMVNVELQLTIFFHFKTRYLKKNRLERFIKCQYFKLKFSLLHYTSCSVILKLRYCWPNSHLWYCTQQTNKLLNCEYFPSHGLSYDNEIWQGLRSHVPIYETKHAMLFEIFSRPG